MGLKRRVNPRKEAIKEKVTQTIEINLFKRHYSRIIKFTEMNISGSWIMFSGSVKLIGHFEGANV